MQASLKTTAGGHRAVRAWWWEWHRRKVQARPRVKVGHLRHAPTTIINGKAAEPFQCTIPLTNREH